MSFVGKRQYHDRYEAVAKALDMPLNYVVQFVSAWAFVQAVIHAVAKQKGWWDEERNDGEMIALMHSELSEALEYLRKGDGPDDKLPQHPGSLVELADVVIREMDFIGGRAADPEEFGLILLEKVAFNMTRPPKHGKKF